MSSTPRPPALTFAASCWGVVRFYGGLVEVLRKLKSLPIGIDSAEKAFKLVETGPYFKVEQKKREFLALLQRIAENPPKFVCEIGSRNGGTLFLFTRACRPDAVLISIDLEITSKRAKLHSRLGAKGQTIKCIRGDSSSTEVQNHVKRILNGNKLDLLFIDGDHSYKGVKSDFLNYTPFVKPAGLVAIHDIVPDFRTRYGIDTGPYSGEVSVFWEELKERYSDHTEELVDEPEQDGYGIGLLHLPG